MKEKRDLALISENPRIAEKSLRPCVVCFEYDHWRKMWCVWIDTAPPEVKARRGTTAEKVDVKRGKDSGYYQYTCVMCCARDWGCEVHEARRSIKQPRTEKHLARAAAFKMAKEEALDMWQFLAAEIADEEMKDSSQADKDESGMSDSAQCPGEGASKRQKKKAVRKVAFTRIRDMKTFFMPVMHILQLKATAEEQALQAAERYKKWLAIKNGEIEDEDDEAQGMVVEQELDETMNVWRAFAKFENQREMCCAADYSDQWFAENDKAFNVYYICLAGAAGEECYKLTLSKEWDRFHDDPAATGQRWYCSCGARYKTKYGVLTEMLHYERGLAYYALGQFPPQPILDAKFMMIEQRFKDKKTAKELFDAIPEMRPAAIGTVLMPTRKRGEYQLNSAMFKDLPKFPWFQLLNLVNR